MIIMIIMIIMIANINNQSVVMNNFGLNMLKITN